MILLFCTIYTAFILYNLYGSFWQSSFREEDFLEIDKSETKIACGGHVCKWIKTK
jgi:hypothetical protein